MEKATRLLNISGGIVLLVIMVIGLVLLLENFTRQTTGASPYSTSTNTPFSTLNSIPYPLPNEILDPTINNLSYPGPTQPVNKNIPTSVPLTLSPLTNHQIPPWDAVVATNITQKFQHTPSQMELALAATDTALLLRVITPGPTATPVMSPVRSPDDIVDVVLNDPFFGDINQRDWGSCLRANQPGKALFVRSLQPGWRDYYVIPFFNNGKICSLYLVEVRDGMGIVQGGGGVGKSSYLQFPPINAYQARLLVEEKTGQKVVKGPELVFRLLIPPGDPMFPFWMVTTTDGQSYYVIYQPDQGKNGADGVVYNVQDVRVINP